VGFLDLVNTRYSFRGFEKVQPEQQKIDYIIECARMAPSAANRQPWRVYLVTNENVKKNLAKSYETGWFAEAPVMVVFTGLKDENWVRNYDSADYLLCDVTIIADYFILAASEMGLGTCYIAAFNKEKVSEALNLPDNEIPFFLTPLGYPKKGVTRERKRKDAVEIIKFIV